MRSKEESESRTYPYALACEMLKGLRDTCCQIAKDLKIRDAETCSFPALAEKMKLVPDLVEDWKKSSA